MANELGIYQLFRNILAASLVIEGRFFILATTGQEINSSNMGEIVKDAMDGMVAAKKYPAAAMLPPVELQVVNDKGWSTFKFTMFFLTLSGRTGDGGIKDPHPETNISQHTKEMDWKDMREVAGCFRKKLREVTRFPPLPNIFREHVPGMDQYLRLTVKGNDSLNGIMLVFEMQLADGLCGELTDYDPAADIVIPDFNTHPLHKH